MLKTFRGMMARNDRGYANECVWDTYRRLVLLEEDFQGCT